MFWYYVMPLTTKQWNVVFDGQSRPLVYNSEDDAMMAALRAARGNYTNHGQPTGVQLRDGDHWVKVKVFH